MITFASDNYASCCSQVMDALIEANQGHEPAYGGDKYTASAIKSIQKSLGGDFPLWFVGTGTAANTLSLKAVLRSYESVICADSAHIITHETGAPHHIVGAKFLTCPAINGKLTPDIIREAHQTETAWGIHATKPRLVSISQSTEMGTVYQLSELRDIRETCNELGLLLHIDGCRIYNAAAALNCSLEDIASFADILSLGGTKAGLMFGEAIVFINKDLSEGFEYLQKLGLQLYSKMRYVSAQFDALFKDDLALSLAREANRLTRLLANGLNNFKEVQIQAPVESNMIFVRFPEQYISRLQAHTHFYCMPADNAARLVISHDVSQIHIENFLDRCNQLFNQDKLN